MIYLVRHAHAGNKQTWRGPDVMRPISRRGRLEAAGLLVQLGGEPIGRIVSSPALRCRQTVEPLAGQRRLAVELDRRLAVDAADDEAAAMLLDPGLGDAVLCTHGELIGQLLGRLRQDGAPITADAAWPKGSIWKLRPTADRISQASYLPPMPDSP